ncbi:cytoskeleton-associated protein 2-like [Sceloporus undulatus]|uniref:cytoskeleton-associated protein 2-like n=1 Tax=Sceloporus undulatus TaxID=8520 RepID=UPI001C4D3630|nr:cytoskeleton-associated protein 2-like [Sceloporus undulatus]
MAAPAVGKSWVALCQVASPLAPLHQENCPRIPLCKDLLSKGGVSGVRWKGQGQTHFHEKHPEGADTVVTMCLSLLRKLLEAWLASRGKCYKRPPMAFSAAKPLKRGKASLNHSFRGLMEEERKEQLHVASEITHTLTECRKMAEEGFPLEELLALVSRIPKVERFAQFWICKAKLQAQQGPLDVAGSTKRLSVLGLCPSKRVGMKHRSCCTHLELPGASLYFSLLLQPLQELRNAISSILKTASEPAGAQPDHTSVLPEEEEAGAVSRRFCHEGLPWPQPLSAIKFQILPLPRAKEQSAQPEVRLLTPVRRSLRIESTTANYPQMLKDHDLVVSSLEEIMATDHRSQFVFRNNEAFPGRVEVASFLTGLATPAKWPR